MSKTPTQLKDLAVGDLIFTNVMVNIADIADPNSKSSTTRSIKQKKSVKRICMVLVSGTTSVQVTYVATFAESTTLPTILDETMWYPFSPATMEGSFAQLPSIVSGKAQWASLRTKQTITANPVEKLSDLKVPDDSVATILAAMKA